MFPNNCSLMKIKFVPLKAHCFAFGGFEIQMLSAMQSVNKLGINASPLNPWSRDVDFDILHCWGLEDAHYNTSRPRIIRKYLFSSKIFDSMLILFSIGDQILLVLTER